MRPSRSAFTLRAMLALAVILICLIVLAWVLWPIHGVVLQVYAVAALLIAFRSWAPLSRWLADLPISHRAIFYALLAGVIIGHFTLDKRTYFPFVAWDIFSAVSEKDPVFCRELIGTTANGSEVRLLVEQLFPSIVQFDLPPADQPEKMEHLVRAMARVYNERHPADPVRRVDLMLLAVQLHPPARESRNEPSCELLQRYDISSAR